jgi:hypothetical protein
MKKLFSVLVGLWLSSNCWSQNSTNQFRSSIIDPSVSRHYITWEEKPNARYEVHLYTKDDNGNEIPIEVVSSEKNYIKLKKTISTPSNGVYFKTISINKTTGQIIDIGIEFEQAADEVPYYNSCSRTCNGIDYAWTLGWWQKPDFYGNVTPSRPGKLILRNAYHYIDDYGFGVPYFRAMSATEFVDWRNKKTDPNIHQYHYINEYLIISEEVRREDCVVDAIGTRLEGLVYFVEKKLEGYWYMQTNNTDDFNQNQMCTSTTEIGFWIEEFNKRTKNTSWYKEPLNGEPTILGCLPQTNCEGSLDPNGGGGGGGGTDDDPFGELLNCLMSSNFNTYSELIEVFNNCAGTGTGGNPPPFDPTTLNYLPSQINSFFNKKELKSYQLMRLDKASETLKIDPKNINYEDLNQIESGLYRALFIFSDYSIVPIVFEHKTTTTNLGNNYAKLDIVPNPIQEILKFQLSSEKNTDAVINIYTLDGNTVYTELVSLIKGRKLNKIIDVNSMNALYNQWRVVVRFPDGTSIQKTAVR